MVFGIGTGRCGTQSLSHLLNEQKGYKVGHEFLAHKLEEGYGPIPWVFDEQVLIDRLKALSDNGFNGDVALYYLNYVDKLMELDGDTKIIVMKRNKQSVINSFMRKTDGLNHWGHGVPNPWDKSFPSYNTNKQNGIGMYYSEYYTKANELVKKYPNNVRIYDIECLNDGEKVLEILQFCGISSEDCVLTNKVVGSSMDGSDWLLTLHE